MQQLDWNATINVIRGSVPVTQFHNWIRPVAFIRNDAQRVVLGVPSRFHEEWIRSHYHKEISEAIEQQCGAALQLEFEIVTQQAVQEENIEASLANPTPALPSTPQRPTLRIVNPDAPPAIIEEQKLPEAPNIPVFQRFFEFDFNRVAYQCAGMFAENANLGMNPLVIYSGIGMGKTHLLADIGKRLCKTSPKLRIRYTNFEAFTAEMVTALKTDSIIAFKRKYRDETDCLLFDDVQGLTKRTKSQEELLHIFNEIIARGGRVVFATSVLPQRLEEFIEPLKSRLLSGLIAEIKYPSHEERFRMLETMARESKIEADALVLRQLADQGQKDIRELLGTLISLNVKATLQKRSLDQEFLTKEGVDCQPSRPAITVAEIIALVEHNFGVSRAELSSKSRKGTTNWARQVAMYLMRHYTLSPLEEIGKTFDRDHSTVIHAFQKVTDMIESHPTRRYEVEFLKQKLQGRGPAPAFEPTLPF